MIERNRMADTAAQKAALEQTPKALACLMGLCLTPDPPYSPEELHHISEQKLQLSNKK